MSHGWESPEADEDAAVRVDIGSIDSGGFWSQLAQLALAVSASSFVLAREVMECGRALDLATVRAASLRRSDALALPASQGSSGSLICLNPFCVWWLC